MKYRPSSPARENWHSSTIAKGTITIYTSWKSADILWKFESILLFLSCIFNCLINTSRNWAPGIRESGISSPCWSGSLHIPCGPSHASPNSWGRVMDLGCDDLSLGVGQWGFPGAVDGIPWSCVACPRACGWDCSLVNPICTETRSPLWESPCLLQTCRQAPLGSCGTLSAALGRGKSSPAACLLRSEETHQRWIWPSAFFVHPDDPELPLILTEKRQTLWKHSRQKLSMEALTFTTDWLQAVLEPGAWCHLPSVMSETGWSLGHHCKDA